MSVISATSTGPSFDPWQQKELVLAQLKISRARTEKGQEKAVKKASVLHHTFLAANEKAASEDFLKRTLLLHQAFLASKEDAEIADAIAQVEQFKEDDMKYWWNQMEESSWL